MQLENTTLERENYRQLLLESQRGTMRRLPIKTICAMVANWTTAF